MTILMSLDPMALFRSMPGAFAQGLVWGLMALGVYITYRLLDFADLTVDGSLATGGAVAVMLIRSGTEENLEKKRELWNYIKQKDLRLFHHLRNGIMGGTMNLPGKGGRKISIAAYKISQKVVGFN